MKWHGVNRVGISWHITGIFIIEFWFLALSVGDLVKSATYPIHAQWLLNLVSMKVNWVPANLLLLYHFYIFIGTSIRMNVKYNFSIPIFYCNIFLKVIFFFFFFTSYLSLHFWSWHLWITSSYIKATISWHNSFANKRLKVAYLMRQHGVNLLWLNVNVLWHR